MDEQKSGGNRTVSSFRELRVWNAGIDLAEARYRLTWSFPRREIFGMTSQIRRASASDPANVAERYGRGTRKDYLHYLHIAQGSVNELEAHLILAEHVALAAADDVRPALTRSRDVDRRPGCRRGGGDARTRTDAPADSRRNHRQADLFSGVGSGASTRRLLAA